MKAGAKREVQFRSVAQSCLLFVTPWTAARQVSLSVTNSRSLLKLMSIDSVMPSKREGSRLMKQDDFSEIRVKTVSISKTDNFDRT